MEEYELHEHQCKRCGCGYWSRLQYPVRTVDLLCCSCEFALGADDAWDSYDAELQAQIRAGDPLLQPMKGE